MKILHTADWHIGKILHKHPLQDEMAAFFDWLIQTIVDEKVDLLLVSGDIFDMANPSIRDKETYYDIIMRLYKIGCKVIITGGNHDSVGELNAPKEILSAINITVLGGAMTNPEDEVIEIFNDKKEIELIVAATPFLRDRDIRSKQEGEIYESRAEAIREGIKNHYERLADICSQNYPKTPAIAMGHLYAAGAKSSESERDIHVGNQAAIESKIFSKVFDYVALGHIHSPQIVDTQNRIRYSGSPIALSFSEKMDEKGVILLELNNQVITSIKKINTPKNRELIKISGTYEEVKTALDNYKPDYLFPSFVEMEVNEEEFSAILLSKVEELANYYLDNKYFRILKHRTNFTNVVQDTSDLFEQGVSIEDLKPIDIFHRKLDTEDIEEETRELLSSAFVELLEEIQNAN